MKKSSNREKDLLSFLKFKRSIKSENDACNAIRFFVQEKEHQKDADSNKLMSIILEQIRVSSNLIISNEETEEHNNIKHTNEYLSKVINSIESSNNQVLEKNTLSDCVDYLKKIAEDASNVPYGEQIKARMKIFIDYLEEKK